MRRFRVLRDLRFSSGICRAGEIVREASLDETGREADEFRRLLSGRSRGGAPRRSGARILFFWSDGFRTAEYGRDLELADRKGWRDD